MAISAGTVVADAAMNTKYFNKSLKEMKKNGANAADKVAASFRNTGEKMRRIGTGMTAAITAPLVGAGAMAVKTAADYEQLQIQLNTLVGSAEKGTEVFEQLKEFSAETPFQVKDIIRANNTLIGMGQSAEEAFKMIQMMGDVSSATGARMQELAITIGQASAEGRLMTRDIRELVNRGVPATKLLADSMGVAKSEIFDLAEQGKISFEVLQQALRDATTQGGIFAGATEKAVDTISGAWSTMKDNVTFALAEVGNVIVNTLDLKQLTKDLTKGIQTIVKRFKSLSDDSKKQILKVAALIGAGGPLLIGLGQAAIAVSAFSKLVRTRFALITGAAALLAGTIEQQGQLWAKVFGQSEKEVDNFTTSARKGLGKIIGPIVNFTEEAIGAGQALDKFRNLLSNLGSDSLSDTKKVLKDTRTVLSFINGDVQSMAQGLSNVQKNVKEVGNVASTSVPKIETLATAYIQLSKAMQKVSKDASKSFEKMKASGAKFATATEAALRPFKASMSMLGEQAKLIAKKFDLQVNKMTAAQVNAFNIVTDVADTFTKSFGRGMQNIIVKGKGVVDVLENIGKLLLSSTIQKGLSILLSGGLVGGGFFGKGGGLLGNLFGQIFHSGGIVGGSGDQPIIAKAGEGVFTQSQMKALGLMARSGGGSGMSAKKMEKAFDRALERRLQKLGPKEIYGMSKDGQRYY